MHVKINTKIQAERGITMLVTQLGSYFDETRSKGLLTLGIGHLERHPIRRVRPRSERIGSCTMPGGWHIGPAIAARFNDRRGIRTRLSTGGTGSRNYEQRGKEAKERRKGQSGE